MQVVVPFAAPLSSAGRQAMSALRWPQLSALLARYTASVEPGDEWSLSSPHERALAAALGWPLQDGLLPMAAWRWQALGHAPVAGAMAMLTPAFWHLGTEQMTMTAPEALALHDEESKALLAAVQPLFESEGFLLHWGSALQWFATHEMFASVPLASLDRVVGRNVDRWLPAGSAARLLRRVQNEAQMLLHGHPLNDERERRGLSPVNSLWLSGGGPVVPASSSPPPRFLDRLTRPALAEDWAAWAAEWALLEAGIVALAPERLVLCGERAAVVFQAPTQAEPWWRKWLGGAAPANLHAALEPL